MSTPQWSVSPFRFAFSCDAQRAVPASSPTFAGGPMRVFYPFPTSHTQLLRHSVIYHDWHSLFLVLAASTAINALLQQEGERVAKLARCKIGK